MCRRRQRRKHQSERLFLSSLAPTQTLNGVLVPRIHQQLEAAESLDRDDHSSPKRRSHAQQRRISAVKNLAAVIPQFDLRPASRTRDRLGMKPPVARIVILTLAIGTEVETPHRRVRPVVRQSLDDAETWTALGA